MPVKPLQEVISESKQSDKGIISGNKIDQSRSSLLWLDTGILPKDGCTFFDEWLDINPRRLIPELKPTVQEEFINEIYPNLYDFKPAYSVYPLVEGKGSGKAVQSAGLLTLDAVRWALARNPQYQIGGTPDQRIDILNVGQNAFQAKYVFFDGNLKTFIRKKRVLEILTDTSVVGANGKVFDPRESDGDILTNSIRIPKNLMLHSLNGEKFTGEGFNTWRAIMDEPSRLPIQTAVKIFKTLRNTASGRFPNSHVIMCLAYPEEMVSEKDDFIECLYEIAQTDHPVADWALDTFGIVAPYPRMKAYRASTVDVNPVKQLVYYSNQLSPEAKEKYKNLLESDKVKEAKIQMDAEFSADPISTSITFFCKRPRNASIYFFYDKEAVAQTCNKGKENIFQYAPIESIVETDDGGINKFIGINLLKEIAGDQKLRSLTMDSSLTNDDFVINLSAYEDNDILVNDGTMLLRPNKLKGLEIDYESLKNSVYWFLEYLFGKFPNICKIASDKFDIPSLRQRIIRKYCIPWTVYTFSVPDQIRKIGKLQKKTHARKFIKHCGCKCPEHGISFQPKHCQICEVLHPIYWSDLNYESTRRIGKLIECSNPHLLDADSMQMDLWYGDEGEELVSQTTVDGYLRISL